MCSIHNCMGGLIMTKSVEKITVKNIRGFMETKDFEYPIDALYFTCSILCALEQEGFKYVQFESGEIVVVNENAEDVIMITGLLRVGDDFLNDYVVRIDTDYYEYAPLKEYALSLIKR